MPAAGPRGAKPCSQTCGPGGCSGVGSSCPDLLTPRQWPHCLLRSLEKKSSAHSSVEWQVQLHRELMRSSAGSQQGLAESRDFFKEECLVGSEAS